MKVFKRALKISSTVFLVLFIIFYSFFYWSTSPKSDDIILKKFSNFGVIPEITREKFKGFDYRKVTIFKDSVFPTIVFVHGAIGSVLDFTKYMTDNSLLQKANMIVYDRVGYNYKDRNNVQESIAFEREMLEEVVNGLNPLNTILVGYSYGGPIALASFVEYKKVILIAPAVYSKVEPMPWMLNFYKSKLTRWLVPYVWKQASKEKLSHKQDLEKFERYWHKNPNKIISIHGKSDWIVPYSNSVYLKSVYTDNQFELLPIDNAGHALIWSHFKEIKLELLKHLN